ncbi:MAG: hypothetical protein JNL21_40750 [Myxococcales bacterium]|nr:hypothetical protein [Myxococcales bacterium]
MAKPNLQAKLDALAAGVLGPLVLGGKLVPIAPLGPQIGLYVGADGRRISDDDLRSTLAVARVRRARLVAPVDTLPDVSPGEWALVAALNDLLQATNHELSGVLTRGRHAKVLEGVGRLIEAVPPPRTTLEALVRHASFARALEIVRTDTTISWWVGSAHFRGQPPSKRLMAWPEARRVNVSPRKVPLHDLCEGLPLVPVDQYLTLVARWLTATPLTDIATIHRPAPPFSWTKPTLELVAYPEGRSLALRTFGNRDVQQAMAALRVAQERLPPGTAVRALAEGFSRDVLARVAGPGTAISQA